ncbi:alpha/beta hydrolase [Streptomyces sp. NPDC093097]|uniref:alpha/beta hydrolase n=1 Tax=Streptomyces sp. NPDC093097 TaxID=3366027 RepID=UPI0037FE9C6D
MPGLRGALAVLAAGALAGALVGVPAPVTVAAPGPSGSGTVTVAAPGSSGGGPDLARLTAQRPAWRTCPAGFPSITDPSSGGSSSASSATAQRFQCARLEVPRDYAHPERGTLRVQMVRLPATGPGKRLGSLVINPGGPGDSGVKYLMDNSDAFAHLGQRYDLVSFDPRGTGHTDPISCGTSFTPVGGTGAESLAGNERRINEACGRYSGVLLPYVGTVDVARDMDVLRSAVGDRKLTYLGFSYGTRLGSVYAHTFPRNAGRLVLDGVEDPTTNTWQTAVAQARSFQRVLDDFAADCVGMSGCPLGTDAATARRKLTDWYGQLTDHPLRSHGAIVDGTTYAYALREALYSRSTWPVLRDALAQLHAGDASGILQLSGQGTGSGSGNGSGGGRRPGGVPGSWPGRGDGTGWRGPGGGGSGYSATEPMPSQDQLALRAISCRDSSERYGPADFPRAQRELTQASPLFGPDIAPTLLDCYGWPVPGDDAYRNVAAPDAPPALLVATTGDPATPYEGAARMARVLANKSVVLTYHGEGHAAYTAGNPCVQEKVDAFLLDGVLPVGGAGCR